jgi:CBS domain containing-hemolysin-like protein
MDDYQSSWSRNGTDPQLSGDKPETASLWSRIKRALGLVRADTTLRETLEGVFQRHAEEVGSDVVRADARSMMLNLIEFSEMRVDDVMVARAEIIAVESSRPVLELLNCFLEAGHSRLPVFKDTLDEPIGMIHIKDFLDWLNRHGKRPNGSSTADKPVNGKEPDGSRSKPKRANGKVLSLSATDMNKQIGELGIMRDLLYVPPSMPASDLLVKMQSTHRHMAIVVDEYGGTDGLATIEDLVEEIVGDIADEHDEEVDLLTRVKENTWHADARLEIEDAEEKLGIQLLREDDEEADTLGGLIFQLLGRVPVRGELIRHSSGVEFEVLSADPRRVRKLAIHTGKCGININSDGLPIETGSPTSSSRH